MRKQRRSKSCFTLMEVMVAVAIIAILSAVVVTGLIPKLQEAKVSAAKSQISVLYQAVVDFHMKMGRLPDENVGLSELVENTANDPKWKRFLEADEVPLDPWGNEYIYKVENDTDFEILSYGADGQEGGEGNNADISNRGIKKQ